MDFDLFRLLFQFKFHKMETSNRGVNKMKQIRILLCESNSEIREQMEQELRKKNDWLLLPSCKDGQECLERIRMSHPDVLVLDCINA